MPEPPLLPFFAVGPDLSVARCPPERGLLPLGGEGLEEGKDPSRLRVRERGLLPLLVVGLGKGRGISSSGGWEGLGSVFALLRRGFGGRGQCGRGGTPGGRTMAGR